MFKPEIKIEKFEVMDVITTSDEGQGGGGSVLDGKSDGAACGAENFLRLGNVVAQGRQRTQHTVQVDICQCSLIRHNKPSFVIP